MSYHRTGLGLSLTSISTAVRSAGQTSTPPISSAAGPLTGIFNSAMAILQGGGGGVPSPAAPPAQTPFAPAPASGMSMTTKIAIGAGVGLGAFVLLKTLKKR